MNNSSSKIKTCAVIPFFNEIATLKTVVDEVLKYVDLIIAIDDGSTDSSSESVKDLKNIVLLRNQYNRGKGYSLKRGLEKGMELGFDKMITIDADLQHDPVNIAGFLEALNQFDMVIGNRLQNLKGMPLHRIASNKITSFLLSIRFKQDILDSQCGFRAFNSGIVKTILPDSTGFEAETEMIIRALRNGNKIGFVPIPTIYGNEKSKMRNLEAIKGFLRVYFRT